MNITLFSTDTQLYRLCREILADCLGTDWQLNMRQSNGSIPDADLTIWDFQPDLSLPEGVRAESEQKHLFLVQRKHVAGLRERLGLHSAGILLKPATRATLSAFIEQRVARHKAMQDGTGRLGSLRADRDEMLQSLLLANLKLQEYDQDRTTFLTRAVHDFRAPLTALNGYCGLMLTEQLGALTEDQKDVLQRMSQSARRLSRMATAMFELGVSKHRDDGGPVLAPGDIRECVEQALHELMYVTEEKNLAVSVDIAPYAETPWFDRYQIEQVFLNLLDNACRFTPKFGSIDIRAYPYFWERRTSARPGGSPGERRKSDQRAANVLRVDIADSGPAIPPEHVDRIFEEYTSYGGGQDRSGGGLGLAICKMILSRHMGRIWVESRPPGAVFSFVLPFRRAE